MGGLTPGNHGFHVHELPVTGNDCDSTSTHYNPTGVEHGDIDGEHHHVGDLGNIFAGQDGNAVQTITSHTLELSGQFTVIGRSLVIHRDEDDLGCGHDDESLANGNSGPRIACCTILAGEQN
mmetsp:Transcript_3348/g.2799  ORF Transcript_3348/g.2799 Transcript_3348/m.2799 type:complete len:122 (+) Transcript_3348:321-686(+)